jgi:predicted acyl esterase
MCDCVQSETAQPRIIVPLRNGIRWWLGNYWAVEIAFSSGRGITGISTAAACLLSMLLLDRQHPKLTTVVAQSGEVLYVNARKQNKGIVLPHGKSSWGKL